MPQLLAENPPIDQATSSLWYALLVLIMAIGIAGMLLLIGLMITRRLSRRWKLSIERDIEERRAHKTPTNDVWSEAAERYVDPDALTAEEMAERESPQPEEPPSVFQDKNESEQDEDESIDEEEDEDDPYGLFRDKPYVDSDDDEEEELEDDEDEDDEDEDEEDDRDNRS